MAGEPVKARLAAVPAFWCARAMSDPARQVLDAYRAAVLAKDVDALVALYDPDVRIFDMWGEWSYDDAAAWRKNVEGWFGSLGSETVGVDFDDVRTIASGDLVVAQAFVTYRGLSAEGKELRAMQNRLTVTLAKKDGAWRIVHEHSSSPADLETGKVKLKR
jgi:uncharacterized protein (TIGR02246 family)